ncbi:PREDICTED: vigilin [Condylura cristata]|uniref:vigilin n=1 Tax=Condylura cristata TaxID=143302 RepID=UPI000643E645|nr:PREDICTED: vigilin [Condylura cristata]
MVQEDPWQVGSTRPYGSPQTKAGNPRCSPAGGALPAAQASRRSGADRKGRAGEGSQGPRASASDRLWGGGGGRDALPGCSPTGAGRKPWAGAAWKKDRLPGGLLARGPGGPGAGLRSPRGAGFSPLDSQGLAGLVFGFLLPVRPGLRLARTVELGASRPHGRRRRPGPTAGLPRADGRLLLPPLSPLGTVAGMQLPTRRGPALPPGVATLSSEEESDPPTYKDAFPPLPEKAACLESAQEPAGAWGNKIRPIKASVITQPGSARVSQDKRAVERLEVEKAFHPFIAGPYNRLVGEIMQETGTRINIPPPSVSRSEIVFTGEKEQLAQAVARIKKIYEEKKKKTTTIAVEVKKSQHKYVIGPKGNSLQEILERTGVSVEIPPSDSASETVILRGEPEKLGQPAASGGPGSPCLAGPGAADRPGRSPQQTKSFTVDIRAKPEYHKFLIGKGGGTIRRVRDSTGARVIFPGPEDKEQDLVTIVGKEEAVREAQRELEALIQSLDNVVEDCMVVDPRHHRHFVTRRGQVLREIADEYGGVMVSFPRSGSQSDRVTLKGAKDCVEAAKRRMQEIVEDLEAQVTLECAIPQRFHRSVMGPKGSRIQQITRDFNVQIKFPDREENPAPSTEPAVQENGDDAGEGRDTREGDPGSPRRCDIVTISGRKEKCEAAKEALEVAWEPPPPRGHRPISLQQVRSGGSSRLAEASRVGAQVLRGHWVSTVPVGPSRGRRGLRDCAEPARFLATLEIPGSHDQ